MEINIQTVVSEILCEDVNLI